MSVLGIRRRGADAPDPDRHRSRCPARGALGDRGRRRGPATQPGDLIRSGHVFRLRAMQGGMLRRAGHTEAVLDCARLAGLPQAGVLGAVVNDDGTVARDEKLRLFAEAHRRTIVTVS